MSGRRGLPLWFAIALAALLWSRAQPLPAQGAITFSETRWQNLFPAGVALAAEVTGAAAPIVTAGLTCGVQDDAAQSWRVKLPVSTRQNVSLRYTWDTRSAAIAPGATLVCQWDAADAAGNQARSPTATFTYEDTRFRWQVRRNDVAAIWTHDAPDALGSQALDLANRAIEHQHRVFQTTLAGPVRITLYNTHGELAAWQPGLPAFNGGRAFASQGATVQVSLTGPAQAAWLAAVIPHEISRLYFYQATGGAAAAPAWLDEGLALYNETTDHPDEQRLLQAAIVRRGLLPLAGLAPALAANEEGRVRLAQAEALSAVSYLMYHDGPDRLAALLAAFRGGLDTEAAFGAVLGRSPLAFEDEWLMWLGVPAAWRQNPPPALTPAPLQLGAPTSSIVLAGTPGQPAAPPVWLLVALIMVALFLPALLTGRKKP